MVEEEEKNKYIGTHALLKEGKNEKTLSLSVKNHLLSPSSAAVAVHITILL